MRSKVHGIAIGMAFVELEDDEPGFALMNLISWEEDARATVHSIPITEDQMRKINEVTAEILSRKGSMDYG